MTEHCIEIDEAVVIQTCCYSVGVSHLQDLHLYIQPLKVPCMLGYESIRMGPNLQVKMELSFLDKTIATVT